VEIFRFGALPVFQAPDVDAGAPEPAPAAPPVEAAAEPVAEPVVAEPAAEDLATEAETAAEPEPKPHGNKGGKPWFLSRISEESEGRRQAEGRARAAEEMLARVQRGGEGTQNTPQSNDAVEARAQQLAAERLANEKIASVANAGVAKFEDWEEKAQMLGAVGAASPAFVLDVVAVDPNNAHEILHALASDPQKAARLAKMDARSRTVELVRMSMAVSGTAPQPQPAPAPKTPRSVSKAPAPPPALDPGASQTVDWRSDKASLEEFSRGWEETQRQRAARGRR
jgi:hypothetical protein